MAQDPGTLRPSFGVIGLPPGENKFRQSGPEMIDEDLISTIETLGARIAWSRAAMCPCAGWNNQTRQPDPTCSRCQGGAVFYFGPASYAPPTAAGDLTAVQKLILAKDGAALIRGVIQRVTQAQDFYDVLGNWVRGTMMVTVRPENEIGYYDRLVNLDSKVVYTQVVTTPVTPPAPAPVPDVTLRYLAVTTNLVQSDDESGAVRYEQGVDFDTVNGVIRWRTGRAPAGGTRLSIHYTMHPTWLVVDHPHVLREIQRRRPRGGAKTTPLGTPTALPLQAAVRLEFLPPRDIPPAPPF